MSITMEHNRTHSENDFDGCLFCGEQDNLQPSDRMIITSLNTENQHVCMSCLESLGSRRPSEWFRWLKRNNPLLWQRVVDNHRLGTSALSETVRLVRVE